MLLSLPFNKQKKALKVIIINTVMFFLPKRFFAKNTLNFNFNLYVEHPTLPTHHQFILGS